MNVLIDMKPNGLSLIYVIMTLLMWMVSGIFSFEYMKGSKNKTKYYLSFIVVFIATIGVFISKDLYSLFVFFEVMSLVSYIWVTFDKTKESLKAGETYLFISILGGMVMLMGLFLLEYSEHLTQLGDGNPIKISLIGGYCLLFGFAAKAGAFPVHVWLPKSYTLSPAPMSALFSAVLSKTGLFGIVWISTKIFYGNENFHRFLLYIAMITMVLGGILALNSCNLKEILACSSISQIGFILTGIGAAGLLGESGQLAAKGSVLHMINHSVFKLILFLLTGIVYMNVQKLELNEIQGFGRKKPLFHFLFLMSALGICAVPGFSGYISKTLLHEGLTETNIVWTEWLFIISGGFTVAYMLKMYILLFMKENKNLELQKKYENLKGKYVSKKSAIVLFACACTIPIFGLLPNLTMDRIGNYGLDMFSFKELEQTAYFTWANLKGSIYSIVVGVVLYAGIAYFIYKKKGYHSFIPEKLHLENLIYHPFIEGICFLARVVCRFMDGIVDYTVVILRKTILRDRPLPYELLEGNEITHAAGVLLESCNNFIKGSDNPKCLGRKGKYEHRLAMFYTLLEENRVIIARSMSFGLFLFCIGLFVVLFYLLTV